jgi:outer membrane receptor for ferric coprogen and ferric-rhodotorulic acid
MLTSPPRRTPFALAAALACCAPATFAQAVAAPEASASAPAATLPAVTVKSASASGASEGSGSFTVPSTSTATGLNLDFRDTPQSVTVITRERIDEQAMTTVADALRNTIGVSLKPVDRGRNNLSARGFDINNFRFDGIPMATGNIGIETANTAIYDRIEVVRGATGLLSGAGDPSAAVNLVRKHADSKVLTGFGSVEVGSWNQLTGTADVTTPLNADATWRARFVVNATTQDAFIDLESSKHSVLYGVIDADLTPDTKLSFGASDQRDRRDGVMWAGLPYWYSDGTRTDYPRSKSTAADWNRWDTTEQTAFATLSHRLANRWTMQGDVSYRHQKEDSMMLWLEGVPDPVTGLGILGYPYHYLSEPEQTALTLTATGPVRAFGREHEVTVGLTHSRLKGGWNMFDAISPDPIPLPDFNQFNGSLPEPAMGPEYTSSNETTTQTGAYVAGRLQVTDQLKFVLGGRVSNYKLVRLQPQSGASETIEHTGEITPYAGVVYDLGQHVSAYASYSDIFNPQSLQDKQGHYLDPLRGNTYELGLKGEFLDGKLQASATVFRIEQDNYGIADGFQIERPTAAAYRMADGVVSKGYELEVTGELARGWRLSAGWTHFSAKDADGLDVAVDHPREQFKLFTTYALPGALQGLTVGGGVNWEGDRPAKAVNPATNVEENVGQPAYAIWDAMARYDINRAFSVQLNVSNLFDKKYRSGSYWWGAPYTYGEPRKVLLSGTYSF